MRKENRYVHSEPFQEIMGAIPSWIIRWGNTIIFIIFCLIVIGCCIIRYPQTILATISISSTNSPSKLQSRYAGIIDTIAVSNGQLVHQGDLLVLLKTSAVYEDIQSVKEFVELARCDSLPEIVGNPIFGEKLELGELQEKWTELRNFIREYLLCYKLGQIGKRRSMLTEQISKNQDYYKVLHEQMDVLEADARLQRLAMLSDSLLSSEGIIVQEEYEAVQLADLAKLNNLLSFEATIKSAEINTLALKQGLYELEAEKRAEEDLFILRFNRIVTELMEQLAEWTEMYTIIAPFDGVVSFLDYWSAGQYVDEGNVIASIEPEKKSVVEGRMKVSSMGFGRIEEGQMVNVRLNGFPYLEYGILKGVISRIYHIPEKEPDGSVTYSVAVSFPNGLVSTYNKEIPFIQDMDGEAEIITQDQRLISHFIQPIMSLFRNR